MVQGTGLFVYCCMGLCASEEATPVYHELRNLWSDLQRDVSNRVFIGHHQHPQNSFSLALELELLRSHSNVVTLSEFKVYLQSHVVGSVNNWLNEELLERISRAGP